MTSDIKQNIDRLANSIEESFHKVNQRIKFLQNKNVKTSQELKHPNTES